MSYVDYSWWESRGFTVHEHNEGRHIVITSDGLHLSLWPTSTDAKERPKWMCYGKTFHAAPSQMSRLFEEGRLVMPAEASEAQCRSCEAPIWWVKTSNQKNIPLDANGEAHFKTCPNADEHRRSAR